MIYEWHTLPVTETVRSVDMPMPGLNRTIDDSSLGEYVGIVSIVMGDTEALCLVAKNQ
jgi:hypothetical protein